MARQNGIFLKTSRELEIMQEAGRINARALLAAAKVVRPGATTADLDAAAAEVLRESGAKAAFHSYPGAYPFPAVTTISVNEQLVHGIPGERILKDGDIVSIDCGSIIEGYVADSALTVGVGDITEEAQALISTTMEALFVGISQMKVGNKVGDISAAIQEFVESQQFNVVREYTGHGVGREMHENPQVPNYGIAGRGVELRSGMTIALEPMVLAGDKETRVARDRWTVSSADGELTAQFEHTIAISNEGPRILTLLGPELDGQDAFRYNGYFVGRVEPVESQRSMRL